jgi:hypothetical protein
MDDEENISGNGVMLSRLMAARSLETDDEKREDLFEWMDLLSYLGGSGLYGLSSWARRLMTAGDIIKPPTQAFARTKCRELLQHLELNVE